MNEAELLGAANDVLTRLDAIFQFWISGTFAVLITFFLIGNRSTQPLKWITSILYLSFSALLVSRVVTVGPIYFRLRERLIEMGSTEVISETGRLLVSGLNFSIYIAGTAITIYFIFRRAHILGDDDT